MTGRRFVPRVLSSKCMYQKIDLYYNPQLLKTFSCLYLHLMSRSHAWATIRVSTLTPPNSLLHQKWLTHPLRSARKATQKHSRKPRKPHPKIRKQVPSPKQSHKHQHCNTKTKLHSTKVTIRSTLMFNTKHSLPNVISSPSPSASQKKT